MIGRVPSGSVAGMSGGASGGLAGGGMIGGVEGGGAGPGGGELIGQFDSRYGGGPGLNDSVHSIPGPKCTAAPSPARWTPVSDGDGDGVAIAPKRRSSSSRGVIDGRRSVRVQ